MKSNLLILALAFSVNTYAEERGWVPVGAAVRAAPAVTTNASNNAPLPLSAAPLPTSALPTTTGGDGSLVGELNFKVDQLQQEVSMLRGQLEEQDHLIKQLKTEAQERYLDLDRRIAALVTNAASTPTVAITPQASSSIPEAQIQTPSEAYQAAMALLKEKKFPEASAAFESFIRTYPKDALAGNALYWSGEVWLVRGENEKALEQFKRVLNDYPQQEKAADAAYKIGVTYHRQGNTAEAKKWLQRVIDTYKGKSDGTVNLAKSYLQRLQ